MMKKLLPVIVLTLIFVMGCDENEPKNCDYMKFSKSSPVKVYLIDEASFNNTKESGITKKCFYQPWNNEDILPFYIKEDTQGLDYQTDVYDSVGEFLHSLSFAKTDIFDGATFLYSNSILRYNPADNGALNQKISFKFRKRTSLGDWVAGVSAADNNWSSIAYGNGLFVAVSLTGAGNRVMTSPDGVTWTIRVSAADETWRSVTYGNGLFVAVASTGVDRIMTSPDGITWTLRSFANDDASWMSVTYGNGLFVTVAEFSSFGGMYAAVSSDGITWTATVMPAQEWRAVTYGEGLFVAVAETGSGNRVATSPDGIVWTSRVSAANNEWRSVTYGNGLFVAVSITGAGNRVMTSPDGIVWAIRVSAADYIWSSVAFGDGVFMAVQQASSSSMWSIDGITWTLKAAPNSNFYNSVVFGDKKFVSVSLNGVGNRVMLLELNYQEVAYTDLVDIKPNHKHSTLIRYTNDEEFDDIDYKNTTLVNCVRVICKFYEPESPEEIETEDNTQGQINLLSAEIKDQTIMEIEPVTPALFRTLKRVFKHNTKYIKNKAWASEEPLEKVKYDDQFGLYASKIILTEQP